jgi:hypothetical protein
MTPQDRAGAIQWLAANVETWRGEHQLLSSFSDGKLAQLIRGAKREAHAVAVANAAVSGFDGGRGIAYRLNPETGDWEQRATHNAQADGSFMDVTEDPATKTREDQKDDEEDGEGESFADKAEGSIHNRRRRPQTTEDWFRFAPPEVQQTFNNARQVELREKDKIVQQLLVNVAESERPAHRQRLMNRTLEELQNDRALVPTANLQQFSEENPSLNIATSYRRAHSGDDMLTAPTMEWDAQSKGPAVPRTDLPTTSIGVNTSYDDLPLDEQLQGLTPQARATVMNALAIEAREKRKLVEEIIAANASLEDDAERRLRNRLSSKSMDELRDYQLLTGSVPQRRPVNYFGSGGGPVGMPAPTNNVNEDLLPPPVMDFKAKVEA